MPGFMRSQPLDRISSTKGRSNTSDSHPALNSLLRRLSNPTKFSSFGRICGQAKGRNTMPRHKNGVRSGSSERTTSDKTREQEVKLVNGLGVNHGGFEDHQNPAAILASCTGPLQRLANMARYFELSFSQDIAIVEEDYGTDMDRENEIQRLMGVVETLTHAKDERLEALKHEIEDLKASEVDYNQERARYQKIRKELEEEHNRNEAEREEDHNRNEAEREKEYKQKLQKSVRAKTAEIEAGSKDKTRDLEKQVASLSATTEKLEQSLSAAEEKLKNKKMKHALVEKSLMEEIEKLKVELKEIKSELPVEGQSAQYYTENFQQLFQAIEEVSLKFFRKLPERAIKDPDTVRQELSKLDPIFASMPIWDSQASEFLRLRAVQHVISTNLCEFIWHPFFPQDSTPEGQFLESVSKSLSISGRRSESAWRVLTLRGINALASAGMASSQVDSAIHRILNILQPLATPSQLGELKHTLCGLVKKSVTLWTTAQKDAAKVIVEARPNSSDNNNWYAEDIQSAGEAPTPPIGKIDLTRIKPFCIFPNINQHRSPNESVLLHRGSAVFPTAKVWVRGISEQKEHDEELEKEMLAARSKVNARRASGLRSPNSPTGGKFPTTQI